ncbi:response regulator [bacterium]|nr:response regulator [bacterium]
MRNSSIQIKLLALNVTIIVSLIAIIGYCYNLLGKQREQIEFIYVNGFISLSYLKDIQYGSSRLAKTSTKLIDGNVDLKEAESVFSQYASGDSMHASLSDLWSSYTQAYRTEGLPENSIDRANLLHKELTQNVERFVCVLEKINISLNKPGFDIKENYRDLVELFALHQKMNPFFTELRFLEELKATRNYESGVAQCELNRKLILAVACVLLLITVILACVIYQKIVQDLKKIEETSQHQRMESLGRLAGSISHDLNNIFTPILLNLNLIKSDINDPNIREILNKIDSYIRKGTKLVKRVLAFSHGKINTFEPEVVKINQIIREVRNLIENSFPQSIAFVFNNENKDVNIWGDSNQLFQVFMNLLLNARDAMPNGGILKIDISTTAIGEQPWICITVSDTGIGIPEEKLDKIFEPFFTTKENGNGIGLATVNAIVKQHTGFVDVKSTVGYGSSFYVYLPMHITNNTAETNPDARRQFILIVDDEIELCYLFKTMLEVEPYDVIIAHNGHEALEIFQSRYREIRLIITDIRMPNKDGIDLIEAVRKIDPDCKVIIASANDLIHHQNRLSKIDADIQGFLLKPFQREELLSTVSTVLKKAS